MGEQVTGAAPPGPLEPWEAMGGAAAHARPPGPVVRVRVPSKINLFLAVRGVLDDGYHALTSVMQTIAIHDEVAVRFRGTPLACHHPSVRRFMQVELCHDAGADVPDGEDNLAVRAALSLRDRLAAPDGPAHSDGHDHHDRITDPPVTELDLVKRIPVAAGMAGGSADAAATLLALNALWGCDVERDELLRLASELGADVPFCVVGGTALATGTGTSVAPVLCHGQLHWVVGIADAPLATADVYAAWDRVAEPSALQPDAVLAALRQGDADALAAALHNDLEAAAFALRPGLRADRDALLDAGALGAIVSGSGPTLLGLARDADHARAVAAAVADRFDRVEVATSPAGGPERLDAGEGATPLR